VLLISRPEELDKLNGSAHQLFKQCMVLRDAAESEDAEDTTGQPGMLRGLHAKVYIGEHGWDTRITMGSANTTKTALVDCRNVELLTEVTGKKSKVGGYRRSAFTTGPWKCSGTILAGDTAGRG
jgi:hypothetical protein